MTGQKARSLHGKSAPVSRDGGAPRTVLCSVDGYLSEQDLTPNRARCCGAGAAVGSRQHDEGRLAQPLPEVDAAARVAAACCDRDHHDHGLGDGALEHDSDPKGRVSAKWERFSLATNADGVCAEIMLKQWEHSGGRQWSS